MKDIIIPEFLGGKEAEPENESKKVKLIWNGMEIRTLKDIRDSFDPEELLKAHMKGDLSLWLSQHYYEAEADAVSKIRMEDGRCLPKLCRTLNVPYSSASDSMELEEKKSKLREMGVDEQIIQEAHLAAFDQEDLAWLLDQGADRIYLCKENFSIPLSVPNVHYVVIGEATIENAGPISLYRENGIAIEGYDLPTNGIKGKEAWSNHPASEEDGHSPLTRACHAAWDCFCDIYVKPFSFGMSDSVKKFSSRNECEKAKNHSVQKAYHEAEKYFNPEYSACVAKTARDFYSERVQRCISSFSSLETLSKILGKHDAYKNLRTLTDRSRKGLYKRFEDILYENRDFYKIDGIEYYQNRVEVEQEDNRFSDDGLFRFIEGIVTDSIQYHMPDLRSVIDEIYEDTKRLVKEFSKDAKREFDDYISEMEVLLDEIGDGLPEFGKDEGIKDYIERVCIGYAAGKSRRLLFMGEL